MEYRSPEVEMLTIEAPVATMRRIEKAGRLCYKSEDNITEESFERFIKGIIKSGHESVIEHGVVSFRIVCSRSCSHQLVRHRLASYSQECVSGDTLLRKNKTIRELYERESNQYGRTHNQTISLRSMSEDGSIVPNKIEEIFYKGKAETYTVKTKMGYEIRATLNHEFSTPNGFVPLRDLKVGDKVRVNGRPSLLKISDEELSKLYLEDEIVSIEYYGEEDVYDLEMKAPYHNYVANGFVVHNSTRYVNYTKEKFGSNIQFIVPQFDRDKQFKGKTTEQIDAIFDIIEEAYVATEEAYFNLIEAGVTPDLAREVLPNGVKTELVMTANMREWRHFIKVRGDRAAHPEIRAVAQLIKEVLQRNYPPLFDDL